MLSVLRDGAGSKLTTIRQPTGRALSHDLLVWGRMAGLKITLRDEAKLISVYRKPLSAVIPVISMFRPVAMFIG